MKLKKLYSLRKDFTIIGLTGRVGSGCSEVANWLSTEHFDTKILESVNKTSIEAEEIKFKICSNYLSHTGNWKPFHIIYYKDVLLLHLFHQGIVEGDNSIENSIDKIIEIIFQNGENGEFKRFTNRFDHITDEELRNQMVHFLISNKEWFEKLRKLGCFDLNACLKTKKEDPDFFSFYFGFFEEFSKVFYEILNKFDITKRTRLVHDLANNLREYGIVRNCENIVKKDKNLEYIYILLQRQLTN